MKLKYISFAIALFLFSYKVNVDANESNYIKLNVTDENNKVLNSLIDNNNNTKLSFKDKKIIINSDEDIYGLYLIWDIYPEGGIELNFNNNKKEYNTKYFQEFIEIDNTNNIIVNINGLGKINDIKVIGKGSIPDDIHNWSEPLEKADMLFMPTHADDEHLFFGGALATYINKGNVDIQVAYMVNHKREPYRQQELLNGLWEIGIRNYPIIPHFEDYYSSSLDHAKTVYNEDEIIKYQIDLIEKFNPLVIVNHDLGGEYGHGAHMLNAHTILKSVNKSKFKPSKVYLHLYKKNPIKINIDLPLAKFGNKTAFEVAQSSFSHHNSQSKYFKVRRDWVYDPTAFGLAHTTVGTDTNNDMLENITTYYEQEQILLKEKELKKQEEENNKKEIVDNSDEVINKDNNNFILLISIISVLLIICIAFIFKKNKK